MRITLIYNPGAGDQAPDLARLERLIREAGHEVVSQSVKDDGWEQALDWPADALAVAGGDGTVGRVAKRMGRRRRPIAPLPAGTANNIARALGLSGLPHERIIASWSSGRRERLDIGLAKGPWGEQRFIEGMGLGLFACVVPAADESWTLAHLDDADAKVTYALHILKHRLEGFPPVPLKAELDGRDLSGEYLMFEALNLGHIGPRLELAPQAVAGDGMLDVVMVGPDDRERLLEYFSRRQQDRDHDHGLPAERGRRLRVEWSGFELHFDDETWPRGTPVPESAPGEIEVAVEENSVEFLIPA